MNTQQPQGPFCQSCAMPMQKPEDFGTEADGSPSKEYCCYCYKDGQFTEPDTTMEQMVEKCVSIMKQMGSPEEQIEQTKAFIPTLKRWKKAA
jgi:hypothetical protein